MMSITNSVVAVFESHSQAEDAIRQLQQNGFDMKNLSIVGKDYHTEEHVVGYYSTCDRMSYWGKQGAFWGGLGAVSGGCSAPRSSGYPVSVRWVAGPLGMWIVALWKVPS